MCIVKQIFAIYINKQFQPEIEIVSLHLNKCDETVFLGQYLEPSN